MNVLCFACHLKFVNKSKQVLSTIALANRLCVKKNVPANPEHQRLLYCYNCKISGDCSGMKRNNQLYGL